MIGRGAIDHAWMCREARARLGGQTAAAPTDDERVAMYRAIVTAQVAQRGARIGVAVARRHLGVLGPLAPRVRAPLFAETTLAGTLAVLERAAALARGPSPRAAGHVDGASV